MNRPAAEHGPDGLRVISLECLLRERWDADLTVTTLAAADAVNAREHRLRRWLPSPVIRRLDRCMARSLPVHPDTGRALYAIALAAGARRILETGTYWGYSTAYLAAAARAAGADPSRGEGVRTFDLLPDSGCHLPAALAPWVQFHRGRPAAEALPECLPDWQPQLFFQDSVHDYDGVLAELIAAANWLTVGAPVLLHDFVEPAVRRAAADALPNYQLLRLETADPQQLGIALPR